MSHAVYVPVVGLDPGHGGPNYGAVYDRVYEKDLTLSIAKQAVDELMSGPHSMIPILTRLADSNPPWQTRYSAVRKASFVISIHVNASATSAILHGAEVYHWPGNAFTTALGHKLLKHMPLELQTMKVLAATDNPTPDDDWLRRPRTVLKAFRDIPTCLLEVGYITTKADREFISSSHGQCEIARGIANAIIDTFYPDSETVPGA